MATQGVQRQGEGWLVPSSTGNGAYFVQWDAKIMRCNCPDWQWRKARAGLPCKHLLRVACEALAQKLPAASA